MSEGRDPERLDRLAAAAGPSLLDRHADPDHHRAVFTLGGAARAVEADARRLGRCAVALLDLRTHRGVHPRLGVLDVVPFVPLTGRSATSPVSDLDEAIGARDRYARFAAEELGLPVFLYGVASAGSARSLPEVRRRAFVDLAPDLGPDRPHPRHGVVAVGARGPLVAYNIWVGGGDLALARRVAAGLRGPAVRALGLEVGPRRQVSCNLVEPLAVGPAEVYDRADALLRRAGARAAGAELVGLLPAAVLTGVDPGRWAELGLSADAVIEHRLAAATS